jgi:hypothetical protein
MPRIVKAITSGYTAMDDDSSEEEESSSSEEEGQVLPMGEEEDWEELYDHPVWKRGEQ